MHKFFIPSGNISDEIIEIMDKEQIHHLKDVLRLKGKEELAVFDDQGQQFRAHILKITKEKVVLKIKERKSFISPEKIKLTIACAIPKKAKFDEIVDKLTQLGVGQIIPLETERVIVKLDKLKKIERLKRWQKIALSASQQSQRNTLPVIDPVKNIKEVFSELKGFDLKLIPTLEGNRRQLKEILDNDQHFQNILVLIGPEGDFTPQEVALAKRAGFIPVSLGDSVLRVDTAALAIASFIRFYAYR